MNILQNYLFHDAKSGPLKKCQLSNNNDLEFVIDLGDQPLCDSLLKKNQLNSSEKFYPLRLYRSKSLGHGQLDYIVPGDEVYFPDYPYRPGITKQVQDHHYNRCKETINKYDISPGSLIVDIGSNDGTLLEAFKKNGMEVIGVEPTNTAKIAINKGVFTYQNFFDENVADKILTYKGSAKIITATNVFAHMATLGKVIKGIKKLLKDDGFFILENHYIVDILKDNQYDTIYHEHIRSYSLKSLVYLFKLYNMKVVDAEVVDRYGGTIRVVISNIKDIAVSDNVSSLLEKESKFGIFDSKVWENFTRQVYKTKNDLMEFILSASNKSQRLVGKSCPGRCSTLINFVGIDKNLMPYIAEQKTSLKLGLYLPGKHIPIVSDDILFKEQPDFVIIFAWHYAIPIAKDLRKKGLKSKFIIPLPKVSILDI